MKTKILTFLIGLPAIAFAASLTTQITLNDSTKNITVPSGSIAITSAEGEQSGTTTTSTNEANVAIDAQITAGNGPGLLLLRNLSTTTEETIDVGIRATGAYEITLNAADGSNMSWAVLPLKSTATNIFHKSATNTPQLFYRVYERGN